MYFHSDSSILDYLKGMEKRMSDAALAEGQKLEQMLADAKTAILASVASLKAQVDAAGALSPEAQAEFAKIEGVVSGLPGDVSSAVNPPPAPAPDQPPAA